MEKAKQFAREVIHRQESWDNLMTTTGDFIHESIRGSLNIKEETQVTLTVNSGRSLITYFSDDIDRIVQTAYWEGQLSVRESEVPDDVNAIKKLKKLLGLDDKN